MSATLIEWAEIEPGRVWRSVCGRYAIVAHTLPENPPRIEYQARKIDPAMAAAYPERGTLGNLLQESPWCWNTQNNAHSAQAVIERDAFCCAHDRSVPADFPAVALRRFDTGYGRALAVVWRDDSLYAQVLGMHRVDDSGFEPMVWTEIDLTRIGLVPHDAVDLATTTDHGPPPCGNCGVLVGEPHDAGCSFAQCLVTGGQRLMCTYFGGSPVAGVEAVVTGTQAEFEEYFKTPTGHDCGQDVWTGQR